MEIIHKSCIREDVAGPFRHMEEVLHLDSMNWVLSIKEGFQDLYN